MRRFLPCLGSLALLLLASSVALEARPAGVVPSVLHAAIDESRRVTLTGNVHPLARRQQFDQGPAPQDLQMDRMLLVLKRSPEQEAALAQLLIDQQDPGSASFHHWLTPDQFGEQFGLSDDDLAKVTSWLESHGFKINQVSKGRTVIEFSGTASQVEGAFHTAIHKFVVNGERHWANVSDPQIPGALLPAVAGVTTLHNFFAKPQAAVAAGQVVASIKPGSPRPEFGSGGSQALAPADYSTIYNIKPLYQAGVNGSGTVIAIVGRSNINVQDVNSFRSLFGLVANAPQVIVNGTDPGDLGGGEELEAVLDTSWAGAVAPNAHVDLVVSASTNTTDGIFLSEQYIINNNLANVMSESFGDCEANYTKATADTISAMAQQAAAQGITSVVSAGDSGSAGCDDFNTENSASGPVSVNVLASTAYTVAVGGTQFNDNASPSQYWSSQNGTAYSSALSYIPEDVWNANCVGYQCGTGSILSGGGGRSQFVAKPSWQSGVAGIPNDGARDLPDVSLTAAGHDPYLLCVGGSCTPKNGQVQFTGVYGTSASTPSFAGIMALVNQKTGSRQGQANVTLYKLAASSNLGNCNGSNTTGLPPASCIFHDVTVGTNAVPGESGYNTGNETYVAGSAYDLASGLGSVNAANLVNNWTGTSSAPPPVSGASTTLFSPGTTPYQYTPDGAAVELGVKIRSDVSGYVTGVRFYKNSADQSSHSGSLWTSSGVLIATGTFTNETGSGWQQLNFAKPVAITPHTTYVASYHTSSGYYHALNYFSAQGVDSGAIHALRTGVDGSDGLYWYGGGGIFPKLTYQNSNYWVDVVFSATAGITSPSGLFTAGPAVYEYGADTNPVELGVKIRSDVSGHITGIRFYKNPADTGVHTGSLWSSTGTLLATGTFSGESGSGWQQLNFSSPVSIAANTTYVASYHTASGYYHALNFFSNGGFDNGTLHALQDGADGPNSVYAYGSGNIFPIQSYQSSNYWIDVVFSP